MIPLVVTLLAPLATAQTPDLNSQLWRPRADPGGMLWTDTSRRDVSGTVGARMVLSYLDRPLVYVPDGGGTADPIVRGVFQGNVVAAATYDRFRFALDVPVMLRSLSDVGGETGLGDVAADLKATVFDAEASPVGLALGTRLSLPTASVATALGDPGPALDLQAIVDRRFGTVLLAFNGGTRLRSNQTLENVEMGDLLFARLGAEVPVGDRFGVASDVVGHRSLPRSGDPAASTPVEGLVGGWVSLGDVVLRGGVGRGLVRGIGAPSGRAILGLAWEPRPPEPQPAAVVEVAPQVPEPEPEPLADPLVTLSVVDPAGTTIDGATWTEPGREPSPVGADPFPLAPGAHDLLVTAPGFETAAVPMTLEPGQVRDLVVSLAPSRIEVTAERITLHEKVLFETNQAVIRPESFALLDEVAATMRAHPRLRRVAVEGHTDIRGSDAHNLDLSERRAAAVMAYLVNHGVAPERLESHGYGESRPVDPADTPAAWERNRRVDIFIVDQDGASE